MSNFHFFWHGPFSQWASSDFLIDGVSYNCAEQFMMAGKARVFNDFESLEKIMSSTNPREQKRFGRGVKNFEPNIWENNCKKIVFQGNLAKFSQNDWLKSELKKTIGKLLVEASPYDNIWGIGMAADDEGALDPKSWRGKNYLGQVLTMVRKDIFKSKKDDVFDFKIEG